MNGSPAPGAVRAVLTGRPADLIKLIIFFYSGDQRRQPRLRPGHPSPRRHQDHLGIRPRLRVTLTLELEEVTG